MATHKSKWTATTLPKKLKDSSAKQADHPKKATPTKAKSTPAAKQAHPHKKAKSKPVAKKAKSTAKAAETPATKKTAKSKAETPESTPKISPQHTAKSLAQNDPEETSKKSSKSTGNLADHPFSPGEEILFWPFGTHSSDYPSATVKPDGTLENQNLIAGDWVACGPAGTAAESRYFRFTI